VINDPDTHVVIDPDAASDVVFTDGPSDVVIDESV
jgi:hypothetical protein